MSEKRNQNQKHEKYEIGGMKRLKQNTDILDRESFIEKEAINYWFFSIFFLSKTQFF